MNEKIPLYGLVLAGGKSRRMRTDKGAILWNNGQEQRYYMADVLKKHCEEVFISCRNEAQKETLSPDYQYITDTFLDMGPYGAILSAFRKNTKVAWLVVACDMPLLDDETLSYLIANRNENALATTFKSPHDGLPEPLITIWETDSYATLLTFLAKGFSCPRKILMNSEVTILEVPNPDALKNINTPEDMKSVLK